MGNRMIFIHGNQTDHWAFGWTPWLKNELEKLGFETFFETFPDSLLARSIYWLPFLKNHVKAGSKDVLIGWSSGAVAAMRYAESTRIKGSLLISPSYTDLHDDLEKQSGYFDTAWKWNAIKSNQEKIALFYGDDDPYIPQNEFEFIAKHLQPEIFKIHEGKHFIDYKTFPHVLEYIKKNYL
jgi:predicted alpha/beta hydrolase family esterase